jgi:hypothetical protein
MNPLSILPEPSKKDSEIAMIDLRLLWKTRPQFRHKGAVGILAIHEKPPFREIAWIAPEVEGAEQGLELLEPVPNRRGCVDIDLRPWPDRALAREVPIEAVQKRDSGDAIMRADMHARFPF